MLGMARVQRSGGGGAARRRAVAVVAAALAFLLGLAGTAGTALGEGSASVSDTTPEPGQIVTVRASGLQPGATVYVDFFGDAVRLADGTVDSDGTFVRDVQIPPTTKDGPKGIVVLSIDADGRFARLPIHLQVRGPAASAELSDTTLVPEQELRVTGRRFLPGGEVYLVLFPERVLLGTPTAGPDGHFAADVRMPRDLLNGRHGIVAGGGTAGGGYAYLILEATVTGGVGSTPDGYTVPREDLTGLGDPLTPSVAPTTPLAPTSTSTSRPTASTRDVEEASRAAEDDGDTAAIVLALVAAIALIVVGLAWLRSTDGRRRVGRWRAARARRRHRR